MLTKTPLMLRSLRLGPVGQACLPTRAGRFTPMTYLHSHRSFSESARRVLGVSKDASEGRVEKAYRKLAMMYHPNRPVGNEDKYMEVSKAFRDLSNYSKRKSFSREEADEIFEKTFGPDVARMAEGGSFNIARMFNEFKDDIMGDLSGTVKSEETLVSYATEKGRRVKITTKLRYADGEVLNRSVTKETVPPGTKEEPTEPVHFTSSTDAQSKMITSKDVDHGADGNTGSDHGSKERSNSRRSGSRRERKQERSDQFDEEMRQMQQMADKEQDEVQESANQVFSTAQKIASKVSGYIFKQDDEADKVERSSRRKSRKKMD